MPTSGVDVCSNNYIYDNYIKTKVHIMPLFRCCNRTLVACPGPIYYVCVYVVVIPFIPDVKWCVDVPAGVTQEEGHTGFPHLPSAVLALIFLARRIQPFLSLVDREVEFCVLTI